VRFGAVAGVLLLWQAVAGGLLAREPLSFEERVRAQEAIERVYYAHRIWPRENPGPKPPFEQRVSRAQLEAKVADYLKKSAALDQFWHRPIEPNQLQAEMDRMAEGTKDPAMLAELFAALDSDPALIAECLARPALADRLIRDWYAHDSRFHGEARARAEAALENLDPEKFARFTGGEYRHARYVLARAGGWRTEEHPHDSGPSEAVPVSPEKWQALVRQLPPVGQLGSVQESTDAFFILRWCYVDAESLEVECRVFRKASFDPWWRETAPSFPVGERAFHPAQAAFRLPQLGGVRAATCVGAWEPSALENAMDGRENHTAVWTGAEMIVWGGDYGTSQNCYQTGGRYSPATDTWRPTPTGPGCPRERIHHTAVWTGTEMIIWGGDQQGFSFDDGGRYNPATDQWTAMPSGATSPEARSLHTAVWSGTEMIVWGGDHQMVWSHKILNTGARFDPSNDTWTATSTGDNNPGPSSSHVAVWTGNLMVVWGNGGSVGFIGGRYDASTDAWLPVSQTGSPAPGQGQTAVWTGSEMIVWGGDYATGNTGGRYAPATDAWTPTSTGPGCPSGRRGHTAVWTGSEMIVWGADSSGGATGGRYNPLTDAWSPTSTGGACPTGRTGQSAVWTGSEMIVWGGYHSYVSTPGGSLENTGGRYRPATDDWVPTSTGAPERPSDSYGAEIAWTGSELVVTGSTGAWPFSWLGAKYNLATDSWGPVSEAPGSTFGRTGHFLFWTGTELLLWGGQKQAEGLLVPGGRYNPLTDAWVPTSVAPPCPTYLQPWNSNAIWTGSEMVVWGWDLNGGRGARYAPTSDAWTSVPSPPPSLMPRSWFTAVWSGSEMILWGGANNGSSGTVLFDTGAAYFPAENTWRLLAVDANTPRPRTSHTALWTGSEMLVWGGVSVNPDTNEATGGRYDPALDRWTATSTGAGCPLGRLLHTAVWTGGEMIVWGGESNQSFPPWLDSGARYDPLVDEWTPMGHSPHTPSARCAHRAIWTGTRMIAFGGEPPTSTGGLYIPELTMPAIVGPDSGCSGFLLSTRWYSTYQWRLNGSPILGATGRFLAVTQSGAYSVTVTDGAACSATSQERLVTVMPPPNATISGAASNSCPSPTVTLQADPSGSGYRWSYEGVAITGATQRTCDVSLTGDYIVEVADSNGCIGTSAAKAVRVSFCQTTETSPSGAVFPARLAKDAASPTAYYLYFQRAGDAAGYNIYEGTLGSWYSHRNAPGNLCHAAVTDLGTGEMRAAITPSAGNHYYLVSAYEGKFEGPTGFSSSGTQIPAFQSSCAP